MLKWFKKKKDNTVAQDDSNELISNEVELTQEEQEIAKKTDNNILEEGQTLGEDQSSNKEESEKEIKKSFLQRLGFNKNNDKKANEENILDSEEEADASPAPSQKLDNTSVSTVQIENNLNNEIEDSIDNILESKQSESKEDFEINFNTSDIEEELNNILNTEEDTQTLDAVQNLNKEDDEKEIKKSFLQRLRFNKSADKKVDEENILDIEEKLNFEPLPNQDTDSSIAATIPIEETASTTTDKPLEIKDLESKNNVEIHDNAANITVQTDNEKLDVNQLEESADTNNSKPQSFFQKLKNSLTSTRNKITGRMEQLLSSTRELDEDIVDELEEILITSDLGVKTSADLLFKIRGQVKKKELKDIQALKNALRIRLEEILNIPNPEIPSTTPLVIMVVGVNGVGKTTSIAKLAKKYQEEGKKVLLAAGDTFRAAAVEQLHIWAKRLNVDIVSQPTGADSSAVVYDAINAAKARQSDVVIIDTAGRLHTKINLMDELKKIKRVADKALPGAPHLTMLVLDANTGQNALNQAKSFHKDINVDSIILTKLDGTSKGGIVITIANELKIPVSYIGIGENFSDLRPFEHREFIKAILE